MKTMNKLTKDERASLTHALRVLQAYHTVDEAYNHVQGSRYIGDRESFIGRHRKAVKLITKLLETEE